MHAGELHYFIFSKKLSQNFEFFFRGEVMNELRIYVFSFNISVQTERVINIVPAGNHTN